MVYVRGWDLTCGLAGAGEGSMPRSRGVGSWRTSREDLHRACRAVGHAVFGGGTWNIWTRQGFQWAGEKRRGNVLYRDDDGDKKIEGGRGWGRRRERMEEKARVYSA